MSSSPSLPPFSEIQQQLPPLKWTESFATILIPLGTVGVYFVCAHYQLYLLAFGAVFYLSFVTYGSCSHDLVHSNCGFSRRISHFWLSVIELSMLRSGTVYRLVHLNHHRLYPNFERDPEGRASYFGLFRTLLEGPFFQFRLCIWALNNNKKDRPRIVVELFLCCLFLCAGVLCFDLFPQLLIFQALVVMGSWVIPFITSYLVHLPDGDSPLKQTRVFRGLFFRIIALDHLYHLEHHLYPMVSHYRWADLARLLNPYFKAANLEVVSFPMTQPKGYSLH